MSRDLSHAELRELLGAFALDAVDQDEREAVERHLAECRPCRTEVAEHRDVAAFLAAGWSPAPDGVWDRIAGALEESPPAMRVPPVVSLDEERARRRSKGAGPFRIAVAIGAAAAVVVVALLGVKIVDTSNKVDDLAAASRAGDLAQAAQAAARQPGARTVALRSPDGRASAQAVLLADGTGYLVQNDLPHLGADRTYQLWAVVGAAKISVGVLGPAPGTVAFHAPGDLSALAITDEVAGGVVVSLQQPTVVGTV
jgi:anti-sigma factor RsiW